MFSYRMQLAGVAGARFATIPSPGPSRYQHSTVPLGTLNCQRPWSVASPPRMAVAVMCRSVSTLNSSEYYVLSPASKTAL